MSSEWNVSGFATTRLALVGASGSRTNASSSSCALRFPAQSQKRPQLAKRTTTPLPAAGGVVRAGST